MVTKLKKVQYVPEQGDLVWIKFHPQAGHEQSGLRPALILSPAGYNGKVGLALICPITSKIKGYPFEVILPEKLEISGAVLSDQVKNMDWRARKAKFIAKVPVEIVNDVMIKIKILLTLTH